MTREIIPEVGGRKLCRHLEAFESLPDRGYAFWSFLTGALSLMARENLDSLIADTRARMKTIRDSL